MPLSKQEAALKDAAYLASPLASVLTELTDVAQMELMDGAD